MLHGRECVLIFQYENDAGIFVSCNILVKGVEAFKCTYLTSLTSEMISSSYDQLIEVEHSDWLEEALYQVKQVTKEEPRLKVSVRRLEKPGTLWFYCAEISGVRGCQL